jgi:hypothetical protein
MRKVKFVQLLSVGLIATGVASSSYADDISLGYPGYGGTGCPQGSASVTLSPDQKSLSILFDSFVAEAGSTGVRLGRKNCNIAIPVHIPQGYSVSIIGVDYRGYVAVPRGGNARLNTEYFFAGQMGPRFQESFPGGYNDDYTISHSLEATGLVWSACGTSVNLRVNTAMTVQSNARLDATMATVDSADFNAGLIYHLQWRRC